MRTQNIHLLPEHIIDQIKAGEVIEKPATLIKELLENSIDAKSTKIDVNIINNGLDLIEIKDNGHGIEFDDLPLAFCRHATSKIEKFEDLYSLYTYGFRGEALASISAVSKIKCISQTKNTSGIIQIEGQHVKVHESTQANAMFSGTELYIKDLFFNTPARLKFLKSQTAEKNQLKKIINAFLLTHPEIDFSIKWDDQNKVLFRKVKDLNLSDRIKDIFQRKNNLVELKKVHKKYEDIEVEIYLTDLSCKQGSPRFNYIFCNDRYVNDIQIHKVISNTAMSSIWSDGSSGSYVAYIRIPSDQIDVNVHPNKTVVKFFQSHKINTLISSAIKDLNYQSPASKSYTQPQSRLDLNTESISFKDLKTPVQSKSTSINDYFNQLDSNVKNFVNNEEQEILNVLTRQHNLFIINYDSKIYFLNADKLAMSYVRTKLQSKLTPTPLLVSLPIGYDTPISEEKLYSLEEKGYEVDILPDSKELILRSFPNEFNSLPYQEIFGLILTNNVTKDYIFEDRLNETSIKKIIEKSAISDLIRDNIIKTVDLKDYI